MRTPGGSTELLECESCGNLGLGVGGGEISCCDRPMRPVDASADDPTTAVSDPTLDDLLRTVFDMSDTELEICLCVMEGGELTVAELAAEVDYDRSVVTRHLNHLADLAVVEKRRQLLERGGQVYVYAPVAPETVRDSFGRLFLQWVREASKQLDGLRREKVEAIVERGDEEPQWRVFREESG
jgi:predicted transcriptional regulator